MATPIERSLIISTEPLRKILTGRKSYEVRSRPTRMVGRHIALSEKGKNRTLGICMVEQCLAGSRPVSDPATTG
jgi:hypothetical protein